MGMSPYNYCAGNPVKLVDWDGRDPEPNTSIYVLPEFDVNAQRTPNKKYNCGRDYYSEGDGGCTAAAIKQFCERRGLHYKKELDDHRQMKKYGSDISDEYIKMTKRRETINIQRSVVYVNAEKAFEQKINWEDLPDLISNPNVDFIGLFEDYDIEAALNANLYHTMVIDNIELIRRKNGEIKNIKFICFDPNKNKHMNDNGKSLRIMELRQLVKLVKFETVQRE